MAKSLDRAMVSNGPGSSSFEHPRVSITRERARKPTKVARSVANRQAWKDDHGAYMVLTAVLIPAVVALGALTFGTTSLWTVHDDLQRSSDLGAAAGAAEVPAGAGTPGAADPPVP